MRLAALSLALLAGITAGDVVVGQEPTPAPVGGLTFRDELEVAVVNVDVYVRDRQGRPVSGLGRESFRVYQDGVAMPLSHFAALSEEVFDLRFAPTPVVLGPTPTPPPAAATEEVDIRPVYVALYVDNENLDPLNRNRVLRQLREFVTANLRPPVQMMVLAHGKSLEVEQPFTDDVTAVTAAIRRQETRTGGWLERESSMRDILEEMTEDADRQRQPNRHTGTMTGQRDVYSSVLQFAEEEANNLAFSLGALREAITLLSGVSGRKSIIYVANGLPMTPGLGLMHEYSTHYRDSTILSQRGRFERGRDFVSLAAVATAQEVTIYTVDAQGLEVGLGGSAEDRYAPDPTALAVGRSNYQDSLRFMASNTGGLAVVNTNDVAGGLERIRSDLYTYYSLGYTINPSGQDRVHRIKVEVVGQADYDLRYRERFVEKSFESRVQDRVMTMLVLDVQTNPLGMALEVGTPLPAMGGRWTVPVRLRLPLDRLVLLREGEEMVSRVVLFAASRDRSGQQSDLQRQEHEIRVPALGGEDFAGTTYTLEVPFLMEEKSYRVAVGLMDQVTRQASFEAVELSVP
jgi:VWFA-related protein